MSLPAIKMRHDISVYVVILGVRDACAHTERTKHPHLLFLRYLTGHIVLVHYLPPFHCIAHQSVD